MTDPAPQNLTAGYETSDVSLRGVLWFGGILAAVAVVIHLALWGMFVALQVREDRDKRSRYPLSVAERVPLPQTRFGSPATGELPGKPRLESLNLASPGYETGPDRGEVSVQARYARDEEELNSYGPVRGRPGVVHIPIDRAMRLVVEESKPRGREPAPMHYDASGGSNSGRNLPEAKR